MSVTTASKTKMVFNNVNELWDAIERSTEVDQDTWRWGSEHTCVIECGGPSYVAMGEKEETKTYWQFTYRRQPEMGLDDVNGFPIEAYEVEPYQETVTKYRRKP